jgi:hypothetical protein
MTAAWMLAAASQGMCRPASLPTTPHTRTKQPALRMRAPPACPPAHARATPQVLGTFAPPYPDGVALALVSLMLCSGMRASNQRHERALALLREFAAWLKGTPLAGGLAPRAQHLLAEMAGAEGGGGALGGSTSTPGSAGGPWALAGAEGGAGGSAPGSLAAAFERRSLG